MIRFGVLLLALLLTPAQAHADAYQDCSQKTDLDRRISGCTTLIEGGKLSPANLAAAFGARGSSYGKQGKDALAIADFTRAIGLAPKTAEFYLNRGVGYEKTRQRAKAIADYQKTFDLAGVGTPQWKFAEKSITRLGGKVRSPFDQLRKAIDEDDQSSGANLFEMAKKNKAVDPCAVITDKNRGWCKAADQLPTGRDRKETAKAFDDLAKKMENAGKISSDEESSKAKSAAPTKLALDESQAAHNRALAHRKKGEYDKAIAEHTKAIKLNPKNADNYHGRGFAYRKKRKLDHAITDFTMVIRLNPKYPGIYSSRGLAYQEKGRHGLAIADFTEEIRLNPTYAYAYNNRGRSYRDKGEYEKAIADHTAALKLKPDFAFAYRDRGTAYARLGNYKKSDADFRKANKLDPKGVMFIPTKVKPAKKAKPAPPPNATGSGVSDELDLAFWNDVKNSNDPAMLQAYLDQFPNGTFASLARIKLGKLKKAQ